MNGNRFLYTDPLPQGKSLQRIATWAKLKCRKYHQNQFQSYPNLKCYNCWETGHRKQQCKNEKVCRVCREPGHVSGSTECKHYAQTPETGEIVVFQGKSNPLSNLYPCDNIVFGELHKSVEHACKLTKAIRAGNLDAAKMVREAATAFNVKQIGHKITDLQKWSKGKNSDGGHCVLQSWTDSRSQDKVQTTELCQIAIICWANAGSLTAVLLARRRQMTLARCHFAHRANLIANRRFDVGWTPVAQQALHMPT